MVYNNCKSISLRWQVSYDTYHLKPISFEKCHKKSRAKLMFAIFGPILCQCDQNCAYEAKFFDTTNRLADIRLLVLVAKRLVLSMNFVSQSPIKIEFQLTIVKFRAEICKTDELCTNCMQLKIPSKPTMSQSENRFIVSIFRGSEGQKSRYWIIYIINIFFLGKNLQSFYSPDQEILCKCFSVIDTIF